MRKIPRCDVYQAINSERTYADKLWNPQTTTSGGEHTLEEWLYYAEDYLREAKTILSREARQTAYPKALHIVRKAAALLIVAMEEHGAPLRVEKK